MKLSTLFFIFISFTLMSCEKDQITMKLKQGSLKNSSAGEEILRKWDFSNASEYSFDSNYVEVSSGNVTLKNIDLDYSGSDFSGDGHVGTSYTSSKIELVSKQDSTLSVNSILPSRAANLLAYWRLDEESWNGSASEIIDGSGNSKHGQAVSGAGTSTGKIGSYGGQFSGGSYANMASVVIGTKGTISHWMRVSSLTGDMQMGVYLADGSGTSNYNGASHSGANIYEVHTTVLPDGRPYVMYQNGIGAIPYAEAAVNTFTPNQWHHITVSWDESATLKLYFDGVLESTTTMSSFTFGGLSPSVVRLGITGDGSRDLGGNLDEISIWNDQLSDSEVESLYTAQSQSFGEDTELSPSWTPRYSDLVGYWKMDGNWEDSSGNGNHGTVAGAGNDATITTNVKIGSGAGEFFGVDDKVEVTTGPSLTTPELSVSFWINRDNVNGQDWSVLSSEDWGNAAGIRIGDTSWGGTNTLVVRQNGAGSSAYAVHEQEATFGQWVHYVAVYTGDHIYLYKNGILDNDLDQNPFVTNSINHSASNFLIGEKNFEGKLDDVGMWSSALTATEISLIYNRQKQKYAGHYESPIINMGASTAPTTLEWLTDLPFMKELPQASESSTDYVTLVGSSGSTTDNDLMSGIVGLWHFNEASWSGASDEVLDSSGQENHGTAYNGATTEANAILKNSATFTGADEVVKVNDSAELRLTDQKTISAWIKSEQQTEDHPVLVYKRYSTLWYPTFSLQIAEDSSYGADQSSFVFFFGSGASNYSVYSSAKYDDYLNKWIHITATYDGSDLKLYINGVLDNTQTVGSITSNADGGTLMFGHDDTSGSSTNFIGNMDEVALWDRALQADEITQLYRRGANRLKIQTRTCDDSTCSANEEWQGPDNASGEYYFSELNNCTELTASGVCDIAGGGILNSTPPSFDLSNGGEFTNYVLAQTPKQYFQYRVLLESDDESATPSFPSLTSINFGTKYWGGKPAVVTNQGHEYTNLLDFSVEKSGDCTPKFQLGYNSVSNWYYFNGTNWVSTANNPANIIEVNDEATISTNISQFVSDVGIGTIYMRAFLDSNSDQACSIDHIQIK